MLPLRHAWSMQDREWALAYCQETAELLDRYLEDDSLFITLSLSYGGGLARGSIGGLLEYQARLAAGDLSSEQRAVLEKSVQRYESARRMRGEAFQQKVEKELKSLLNTWAWYLDECKEDRQRCAADYVNQVWRRTRIHVLQQAVAALPAALAGQLARLDGRLRELFRPGDFVWDAEVRPFYSEAEYWWLYGGL